MPPPTPPIYLIREQVDAICRSGTFDKQELLRNLLRFIVEQTIAEEETTEAILDSAVWRKADAQEKIPVDKTKVRVNVGRLRDALSDYYQSQDALTAIVVISVPHAGLDAKSRKFKHYSATFEFHPGMLRSAAAFGQVLFRKYGLPPADGERWFNEGTEAVDLLRTVIQLEKATALLIKELHYRPEFDAVEKLFNSLIEFYDQADAILVSVTLKDIKNRNIQIELAVPYVSDIMRSAGILSSRFMEWASGRLVITPEIQDEYEGALAAIQIGFARFLDKAEAKLLPPSSGSDIKEQ